MLKRRRRGFALSLTTDHGPRTTDCGLWTVDYISRDQRQTNDFEGPQPARQAPDRICLVEDACGQVKKSEESEKKIEDGRLRLNGTTPPALSPLRSPISYLRSPIPCAHARIREIDAQEGNSPPVAVLFIDRPLRSQVINENSPVAGEGEEEEERRGKREDGEDLSACWLVSAGCCWLAPRLGKCLGREKKSPACTATGRSQRHKHGVSSPSPLLKGRGPGVWTFCGLDSTQSQRDCITQPRVARGALPWVCAPTFSQP